MSVPVAFHSDAGGSPSFDFFVHPAPAMAIKRSVVVAARMGAVIARARTVRDVADVAVGVASARTGSASRHGTWGACLL